MAKENTGDAGKRKAFADLANKNPEWFDLANATLRKYHNEGMPLLHALMIGLMEAHAHGVAGTKPTEDPAMIAARKDLARLFPVADKPQAPTPAAATQAPAASTQKRGTPAKSQGELV